MHYSRQWKHNSFDFVLFSISSEVIFQLIKDFDQSTAHGQDETSEKNA